MTNKIIVTILGLLLFVSCTKTPKKIECGKQCTGDGSVYSYVWIKDVIGETDVKKTNCI